MNPIFEKLERVGMIPVIKLEDTSKAAALADALMRGGIPVAEVTFRAAGADHVIRQIRQACPDMAVGAGTVLTVEQAKVAIDAGALYIVAPGLNPKVVSYCQEQGVPVIPGCATPSEIEQALEMGLEVVKFFPAEQLGGLATIKALCGPYSNIRFIPTGGINLDNLTQYLTHPRIVACGGTFMVKTEMIDSGDWDGIVALCRRAMEVSLGFSLDHVGINPSADDSPAELAGLFGSLFRKEVKEGNSSHMVKGLVEVMKKPYLGASGHLAISTNSILRACEYLRGCSVEIDESTWKKDAKGNPKAVYLKDEIGGFAVHLVQR